MQSLSRDIAIASACGTCPGSGWHLNRGIPEQSNGCAAIPSFRRKTEPGAVVLDSGYLRNDVVQWFLRNEIKRTPCALHGALVGTFNAKGRLHSGHVHHLEGSDPVFAGNVAPAGGKVPLYVVSKLFTQVTDFVGGQVFLGIPHAEGSASSSPSMPLRMDRLTRPSTLLFSGKTFLR